MNTHLTQYHEYGHFRIYCKFLTLLNFDAYHRIFIYGHWAQQIMLSFLIQISYDSFKHVIMQIYQYSMKSYHLHIHALVPYRLCSIGKLSFTELFAYSNIVYNFFGSSLFGWWFVIVGALVVGFLSGLIFRCLYLFYYS